ncbi:MAG: translation elongation factor Ts [Chlamydiota bacterium]
MSAKIKPEMVAALRKRTGVGMSKCKEALIEAQGDMEEAIHILRKQGMASAVKKSARETKEGIIGVGENEQRAYLVEVSAETDFVIQNDRFKEFLRNICDQVVATSPNSVDEFLTQKYAKKPTLTVDEYRTETIHTLGENIQIKRLLDFKKQPDRSIGIYSHMGGKIVAVVVIKGSNEYGSLARDVAMHVAAEAPDFLRPEDVPAEVKTKEEEVARSQIENKPANIIDKIVEGKLKAFYEQTCLFRQKYVKDPALTIVDLIEQEAKKAGKTLEIVEFVRWQIGE